MDQLQGRFHAHITLLTEDDNFKPPSGWKTTIILLDKDGRSQKDIMITRHYVTDTSKTKDVYQIFSNIVNTCTELNIDGHQVDRVKLEHESLPTLPISKLNYREAHVKVKIPKGIEFIKPVDFVRSSNTMSTGEDCDIYFYNFRQRNEVSVELCDAYINYAVEFMTDKNPLCEIMDVKIESTVFDTNQQRDSWWA